MWGRYFWYIMSSCVIIVFMMVWFIDFIPDKRVVVMESFDWLEIVNDLKLRIEELESKR